MLFGIAERTIWLPPTSQELSIELTSKNPLVLVPNQVLTRFPGKPNISVRSESQIFVSTGRQSDIEAWIGQSDHDVISLGQKGTQLIESSIAGPDLHISPKGSDLWRSQTITEKVFSSAVTTDLQNAVLIASDGISVAPRFLTLKWLSSVNLTLSTIEVIVGLVLVILGLIFNIWAYSVMRRQRGPRRKTPKPPHGPRTRRRKSTNRIAPQKGRRSTKRAFMALPTSMLVIGMAAGCSIPSSPNASSLSPSPSASLEELPPAVVTAGQLGRILEDVSAVTKLSDSLLDYTSLAPRFFGPALAVRKSHYLLRQKRSSIAPMAAIDAAPISFSLPEATNSWPRTIMAVTDLPNDGILPQMIVLQQKTPRENYLVWYTIGLMPGASIPPVAASEVGAVRVAPDSLFLTLPPNTIPEAFGDVINLGSTSAMAKYFDVSNDEFYLQVSQSQAAQVAKLKKGKISFTHTLGDPNVITLATMDAGAIVALYMNDNYLIKPRSSSAAVSVSGDEKLLLGADGSARGVKSVYGDMMVFFVPSLSSNTRIRLIGATQGLISVRGL